MADARNTNGLLAHSAASEALQGTSLRVKRVVSALHPLLDARGERDNVLYSATFTPGLILQQLLN